MTEQAGHLDCQSHWCGDGNHPKCAGYFYTGFDGPAFACECECHVDECPRRSPMTEQTADTVSAQDWIARWQAAKDEAAAVSGNDRKGGPMTDLRLASVYRAARNSIKPMDDSPISTKIMLSSLADEVTNTVIDALRSLPVEQRMEVMGAGTSPNRGEVTDD